jgi:hypothetical protein
MANAHNMLLANVSKWGLGSLFKGHPHLTKRGELRWRNAPQNNARAALLVVVGGNAKRSNCSPEKPNMSQEVSG